MCFVLTLYDKFHCYVVILFSGGVIDSWTSFMVNLIPVLFFIGMCYICKSETQVNHYHVSRIFESLPESSVYYDTFKHFTNHVLVYFLSYLQLPS